MRLLPRSARTVAGHRLPPPRLTAAGARTLLLRLVLPASLVFLALDAVAGVLVREATGACVALWCLL